MLKIEHHHYFHGEEESDTKKLLHSIINKLNIIMANEAKALEDLTAIKTQLQKIGNESAATLQKVKDLEEAAQNSGASQAVLDKIAEVKAQAQLVDDLTPDAETPGETQP